MRDEDPKMCFERIGLPGLSAPVSPGKIASAGRIRKCGLEIEKMCRMTCDEAGVAVYAMSLATEGGQ
jgi:hypothetical protein